jgi:hypothetical protein
VQNDGSYLLTNVPLGAWMTYAWDCAASPKYGPGTFGGSFVTIPGLESNPLVAVFVNSTTVPNVEVNFTLVKSGAIKVKALGPGTNNGIPGAVICPYFGALNIYSGLIGSGKCATANAKGIATIKGVQPGASKLLITASGYLPLWYGGTDFASATSVAVLAGKTTNVGNVDVDVDPAGTGTVSGRITSTTGAPIPGSCATVWTESAILSDVVEADGSYTITGVPAGFWEVTATGCDAPSSQYAPTVYKNHLGSLDSEVADRVLVLDGAAVTGIDMKVARGGTIEVHVIDSSNSLPIGGASACPFWWKVNPFGHQFQSGFCTDDPDSNPGVVSLVGVAAGKNKVLAFATGYFGKYFGGPDFASAAIVTVGAGGVTIITIALDPAPPI